MNVGSEHVRCGAERPDSSLELIMTMPTLISGANSEPLDAPPVQAGHRW